MPPKKKANIIEFDEYQDPLDKYGESNNFLTNKPYTSQYKELAKLWSKLPLYEHEKQIKKFFSCFEKNQVILVISGTGSGKTVLIPKFALKYLLKSNNDSKIVITNPKILTTIYNAEYSAKTLDVELGNIVGYKFRGAPENMSNNDTKLLYSTDGLLLAQILKDKLLSNYNCVIIDEAHERQVPIDLLLYFLKDILKQRPDFKLIIMSATIDAEIFKNFYEKDKIKFCEISISGQSNYPITSIWMKPEDKINFYNYMDIGIAIILKLLEENKYGDILMFVTSQKETEIGCNRLKVLCGKQLIITEICDQYYCAEVYSKMSDVNRNLAVSIDEYKNLNAKHKRKVIFATNVAESSITLDGIVYVIDTGLELLSYFDYIKNTQIIEKRYTTQAQIKQRMGRAGRTQTGICYHLYSEDKFNKLTQYPSPNINLTKMNEHFLSFMRYRTYLSDSIDLCKNLISPVSPIQIMSAVRYLHFYNIIKIVNSKQTGGINSSTFVSGGSRPISSTFVSGGDDDSIQFEFNPNEVIENKDELDDTTHINYKDFNYNKMTSYDSWNEFQGALTRFGKIVQTLNGYPIELAIMGFYGKLLNLPMIYSMIGIIGAMDGKIDNLIRFPNIKLDEKQKFINDNFPDAIINYSEHIFLYNLLTNYYEMGKNLELLNTAYFEKVNDIKSLFSKTLDKIKDEEFNDINNKYNLISPELLAQIDNYQILDKLYIVIYLAFRYNTIRLVNKAEQITYQTYRFIENTTATINFQFGQNINAEDADLYSWGICNNISNVMGKTYINGCTLIPNDIMDKIKNYFE